ncbi:MAG: hypothetical protein N2321_00240 [Melioribacteraceae bacterium]|nr:hypothetical protein [Melioribacteraceae bacterium]
MKKYFLFIVIVLVITSCMPGTYTSKNPAGLLTGIWHGWIAPISLILGFFNNNIRIYEINNTGWWYDFGFYIAMIGGFGSFSLFRKKKKD